MYNQEMTFLSKEKLEEFISELTHLRDEGRRELAERLDEAKSLGDLSENAEYHQARDDQGKMESRIRELEYMIKNVEIIEKHHSDVVELGVVVVISKKNSSNKQTFEITGKEDADTGNGKIDMEAPLSQAMFGKKTGDYFDFNKPNGEKVIYKIVSIK